ncbi:predicted protein [Mycobacterium tuberculosis variant africanum K85]|uniref:Uncharacterized protein n=1 Tax=Mycobacterium tuberculosis variant africanum K85 TaxID=611304 RepID=A0A9P2H9F7_MYCTX|nr:predicted protein [Mycobacterium tuberculosis variant africanum K85]
MLKQATAGRVATAATAAWVGPGETVAPPVVTEGDGGDRRLRRLRRPFRLAAFAAVTAGTRARR